MAAHELQVRASLAYCARVLVKQERKGDEGFEAKMLSRRVCYKCGKEGHLAFECTEVSWEKYEARRYRYGPDYASEGKQVPREAGDPFDSDEEPPQKKLPVKIVPKLPSARGAPRGPPRPPPRPPPPMMKKPPAPAGMQKKKKKVLSASAKKKALERDAERMRKFAKLANDNSKVDLEAINKVPEKIHVEYILCKRTGKKIRKDMWESHVTALSAELTPYLYLGGERNARNHKELTYRTRIGYVLNCAWEVPNFYPEELVYLKMTLSDVQEEAEALAAEFDRAVAFIDEARSKGSRVLVHCVAGISRSTSICLVYLMKREGYTLRQAYDHVKAKRSIMRPNKGFLKQLMKMDREIHGSDSVVYEELYPPDEKFLL